SVRITPRREEVEAIRAILESQDYDTSAQMAKAVIKASADALAMRDWFALGHRFREDQPPIAWAPFASGNEAWKVAQKIGLNGEFGVLKLHSSGVLLGNLEGKK